MELRAANSKDEKSESALGSMTSLMAVLILSAFVLSFLISGDPALKYKLKKIGERHLTVSGQRWLT
jgi:hypothetical protein